MLDEILTRHRGENSHQGPEQDQLQLGFPPAAPPSRERRGQAESSIEYPVGRGREVQGQDGQDADTAQLEDLNHILQQVLKEVQANDECEHGQQDPVLFDAGSACVKLHWMTPAGRKTMRLCLLCSHGC